MNIHNTADDPRSGELVLLEALITGDGSSAIVNMEKRGQRQLVASSQLPTKFFGNEDELIALGFTLGETTPGDPMFRAATLPEGWVKEPSDHDMWSYVVDQYGRRRVSIFYKAAFYDRSAHMTLETRSSYLRARLRANEAPVLDDTWLTLEVAREELEALADEHAKAAAEYDEWADKHDAQENYAREKAAEMREQAAASLRLRDSLGASA